ncbi:MAG: Hsp20 family protein [Spirochaetota bacterium]
MKTLTLYNSLMPMFRATGLGSDPYAVFERLLDAVPASSFDTRSPVADISESENAYLIEVELPGLSEKDLKLEIKDGVLSLSTAVKEEVSEEKRWTWLRRERREFHFARSFLVPDDADGEGIEAKLKDGLLAVTISKKPATAPRIVPVKVA